MTTKTHSIDDLPTNYLKCRVMGHSWDEYKPVGKKKPQFGFRLSLLCVSCTTQRHDLIDTTGNVGSREYEYAEGYQLSFSLSRSDARIAYKRRRKRVARRGELTLVV